MVDLMVDNGNLVRSPEKLLTCLVSRNNTLIFRFFTAGYIVYEFFPYSRLDFRLTILCKAFFEHFPGSVLW